VYRLIEKHGFNVVDPASMTVVEQLAAMRHARVIAGPHGAQFVHAQFMPESSAVIECFSPIHVNPSILQICRVLNHSYRQIVARTHLTAPYPHGRDCVVDVEHLAVVLDSA
jgi:capsular polysaccharide biosynthesis protein